MVETILPGTYVTVRDEALISAGRVVSGNIGIVGTASKGEVSKLKILGSFSEAREVFGDTKDGDGLTLISSLEQIYNNGGRTVYAVRTASATVASAAYQTKDSVNANLVKLLAKTPGTWGNDIRIKISAADAPSLIRETLAGNATNLRRSQIVANSGLNSIVVKQKSTGLTLRYEIVYGVAPDNTKPQVEVVPTTGALVFTTLTGFVPGAADTILAVYEVPAVNSKKVELSYQAFKETYSVADASHLATLINQSSTLVFTEAAAESAFLNQLPKETGSSGETFGTGLDGNTAGADGEDATPENYKDDLEKLENEIINIVLLAGQDASNAQMVTNLVGHLNTTAEIKRERIGIIGSGTLEDVSTIAGHSLNSDRLIFVAPGIKASPQLKLTGAYTAAAVAGLIAALPVQGSPTNKPLNIPGLSTEFSASQLEKLVTSRVLMVEKRDGFKVVKGITTSTNSAWHQITTRRIVDFAVYGVRSSCDPYIGKLNNDRVRGAMKATLDAFLTRMVQDEALISYELAVTATRAQEIAGEAIVTMTVRPTFSIDFIKVTLYLG
jgi:Phage tail sheath protein subtilisin-like domain/Phage tail sheath C-terminal domain